MLLSRRSGVPHTAAHTVSLSGHLDKHLCVFCQVEMEDFNPDEEPKEAKEEEEEEEGDLVRKKTALFHSHSYRQ